MLGKKPEVCSVTVTGVGIRMSSTDRHKFNQVKLLLGLISTSPTWTWMRASVPWFFTYIISAKAPISFIIINRTEYSRIKIQVMENRISFRKLSDAAGVANQWTSYPCFPK